ncbi:hypothetical protein [Ligilactobacillus agilis]|uniref:hypothetical protein n=1 Tax=Ligilactobacillus agilis TaxID=1601 RepID=UPI003F8C029F
MKGSRFKNIKENNNIKKVALGIGSSVVLFGIIAGGILYNHNKQVRADQINSELALIRKETNAMKSQKNDQKRINDLRKLEKDFKEYSKKKEQNNKVSDYYEASISSGRQYFTDRTSRRIKNNTLTEDQLKKINQKDLQSKVDALNNEKSFMKQNKDVVYSSDDIKMFGKDIDKLLKQYNEKLNEMKKDKEKEAEEASAAANSSSDVAQSSQDNNSSNGAVAATTNNNTTENSQYSGTNSYSNTTSGQTQSYSGSNGNAGNSYNGNSGGPTYHQTYSGGNGNQQTYHAPSQQQSNTTNNSGTRTTTDYGGIDPDHWHYVGKSIISSNHIHVETTKGSGDVSFNE